MLHYICDEGLPANHIKYKKIYYLSISLKKRGGGKKLYLSNITKLED